MRSSSSLPFSMPDSSFGGSALGATVHIRREQARFLALRLLAHHLLRDGAHLVVQLVLVERRVVIELGGGVVARQLGAQLLVGGARGAPDLLMGRRAGRPRAPQARPTQPRGLDNTTT